MIKEKQRAIGIMPMLYLCFPITELESKENLLGRTAEIKEAANLILNKDNATILLELLKIFGILSKSHKHDILKIIETILT